MTVKHSRGIQKGYEIMGEKQDHSCSSQQEMEKKNNNKKTKHSKKVNAKD